jgi:hypothetical protein
MSRNSLPLLYWFAGVLLLSAIYFAEARGYISFGSGVTTLIVCVCAVLFLMLQTKRRIFPPASERRQKLSQRKLLLLIGLAFIFASVIWLAGSFFFTTNPYATMFPFLVLLLIGTAILGLCVAFTILRSFGMDGF